MGISGRKGVFRDFRVSFRVEEKWSRAVDGLPSAINKPRGFSVYSHGSG